MKKLSDDAKNSALSKIATVLTKSDKASRQNLFDRFMDEPYGDEQEGSSQFRATDVADVVEAVYAEAMEVFTHDDHLVEFTPVGVDDEADARQETAIIHHFFRDKNQSFVNRSTWFKEGLIEQNAYIRAGWVDKSRVLIEAYEDLSFSEFMTLYARIEGDKEIEYEIEMLEGLELDEDDMPIIPMDALESVGGIDCRIRCVKTSKQYEIEPIPQNEIKVWPRWTKITLEGCPAVAHEGKKTKSELRDMGFDEDSIKALSSGDNDGADDNRHSTEDNDDEGSATDDDEVDIVEAYVLTSVDDGEPERLLKIWASGDGKTVLKWDDGTDAIEEVEGAPFIPWTPYIVPHRHTGRSVAELAAAIQKLKTVLWRHTLDNMYATNNVRPVVVEELATETTYEDLISNVDGAPIRVGGAGAITWDKPPSILGDTLPLMDRADQDLEKHAGATRYAQGLDPSALGKSNVGSEGVGRIMDAAMRRIQVIIRTFAETGLRELFVKMHSDMRRGPVRQVGEKINGSWVEANPVEWRDRTDLKVRVGTGRGDSAQRLAALTYILGEQKEALTAGAPHVSIGHIYETQKQVLRNMGLPSIDPFMADPNALPPTGPEEPTPPTPTEQAQIALAQAEGVKAQAALVNAQTAQEKAKSEDAFKQEKLRLDRDIAEFNAQEATALVDAKRVELEIKKIDAETRRAKVVNDIEGDQEDRDAELLRGNQ